MDYSCLLNWVRSIFQDCLNGRHRPASGAVPGRTTVAHWCDSQSRSQPLEVRDESSTINVKYIQDILLQATQIRR
jgi:hypothetical protein